jgi:acetyl-CoA carboxylase biotin carboxyl carrier protein
MTTTSGRRSRPVTGDDGSENSALLEQMRHSVAAMAQDAAVPLRRVRLTLGAASVEVEWENRPAGPSAAGPPAQPEPATTAVAAAVAHNEHVVVAPLVGTFYVAPEPGAAPFVKAGDSVVAGQQIGIVEAMKLMNPVESDRAGTVLRVLADDGSPVEYEQPLLLLAGPEEG